MKNLITIYLFLYAANIAIFSAFLALNHIIGLQAIHWATAIVLMLLIAFLDNLTTQKALKMGATEQNPLGSVIINKFGLEGALLLAVMFLIPTTWFIWQHIGASAQYTVLTTYSLIPLFNYVVIQRRKRKLEKV